MGALALKLYENGLYEGFVVGKEKIHVRLLQYAVDTPLFCKHDEGMLLKLKGHLRVV